MRGRFITFEGGEGAGKSTQVKRLQRRLRVSGFSVVVTREPGGSPKAEKIREALLAGRIERYGPFAEALLFASARADHVKQVIRPALERGAYVISDRFTDSTAIYQGVLGQVDAEVLQALDALAAGPVRPSLTLVLDVPAALGFARASDRQSRTGAARDRFEAEGADYHQRVREAFLTLARQNPERCAVIDASGEPDQVELLIWAEVKRRLLTPARETATGPDASRVAG